MSIKLQIIHERVSGVLPDTILSHPQIGRPQRGEHRVAHQHTLACQGAVDGGQDIRCHPHQSGILFCDRKVLVLVLVQPAQIGLADSLQ